MERNKLHPKTCISPYCSNKVEIGVACKSCYYILSKNMRWDLNTAVFSTTLPNKVRNDIIKRVLDRLQDYSERILATRAKRVAFTVAVREGDHL